MNKTWIVWYVWMLRKTRCLDHVVISHVVMHVHQSCKNAQCVEQLSQRRSTTTNFNKKIKHEIEMSTRRIEKIVDHLSVSQGEEIMWDEIKKEEVIKLSPLGIPRCWKQPKWEELIVDPELAELEPFLLPVGLPPSWALIPNPKPKPNKQNE